MLKGAFDAGGSEYDQPVLMVAGFVSSAKDWDEFSALWSKRLGEDHLTHFHAVDFAHSREEFAHGWKENEPRRQKLLADLMELIRSHAYQKFGSIVVNESFQEHVSEEIKRRFVANAYVLAGWGCAADMSLWAKREKITKPFRLVFEDGDIGKGKLVERLLHDGYTAPTL